MTPFAEEIAHEIARSGPMTFRRFMERALYDPEHGYYASGRVKIGREGDFVTSVSIGPLFAKLVALEIRAIWERLGEPERFTMVEQGADGGDFAHDFLSALVGFAQGEPERWGGFAAALEYRIVEPFAVHRRRQEERLASFQGKVTWAGALEELEPWEGVHFSNELLDAMPVHRVVWREGAGWRERYVNEALQWEDGPLSTPELAAALEGVPQVEGYESEVALETQRWIGAVAARMKRGVVLLADYGFSRSDYYLPERREGTLSAYRNQQRQEDPLANPGEVDLTAHVEFTSLTEHAEALGFRLAGFTDQHHYLVALGKELFHDSDAPPTPEETRERRAFISLMHPGLLGRAFRFLALTKGIDPLPPLPGFALSPEPRGALGV